MRLPSLLFAFACSLFGQETRPAWRGGVDAALAEGRERVALSLLASEIEKPALASDAARMFIEIATELGEVERADAVTRRWLAEAPDSRDARIVHARGAWRRGDVATARAALAPLLSDGPEREDAPKLDFEAVALAGRIEADRGDDAAAEVLFDRLVTESQRLVLRDGKDLAALAHALLFFGGRQGVQEAEKALIDAQKLGGDASVDVTLGWLYLERKYLPGDAVAEFKAALKKRAAYIPALVGLHAANEAWMRRADAEAAIAKASSVNPSHPDVAAVVAAEDLENFRLDAAGLAISRGLAQAEGHKTLRALDAARALLSGDRAGFDAKVVAILASDPTDGAALQTVAAVLNERRRWPEALAMMERAVTIDPKSPALLDDLARYQLYLGKTKLARATLKAADEADAFGQPWRGNIQKLLRWIERRYQTVDTERFAVRMDAETLPALSKIMLPFFERSYTILAAKYQHAPGGVAEERARMLIEVFRDHQDFSVRTFGFSGLGALGVCFGPFIAMDGPHAMPAGEFSWARTFHHELAHTMTLGLSQGRVPRWLTEGLSTFEESQFEPSWTRGMDRELFDAYHTDDLLPVLQFDPAFMSPRIIFAYYQAGLLAGHLVETFGMDRMIRALRLLGEDRPVEEVFTSVFGVSPADVDASFRKHVATRIASMKMMPRPRAEVAAAMEEQWKRAPSDALLVKLAWARFQGGRLADVEALLAEAGKRNLDDARLLLLEARLAEKLSRPDRAQELFTRIEAAGLRDFDLAMDFAKRAERKGEVERAMKFYREAIDCFPTNADKAGPRVGLARMLRGGGRSADAIALLEEHLRHSPEDLASRRAVIDAHKASGAREKALAHLEQFVLVFPLDDAIHRIRAEILLDEGRSEEALLSADCAVATAKAPVAVADGHVLAARSLIALSRKAEAEGRLRDALDAAPDHAAAKSLLAGLEAVGSESR